MVALADPTPRSIVAVLCQGDTLSTAEAQVVDAAIFDASDNLLSNYHEILSGLKDTTHKSLSYISIAGELEKIQ